MDNEQINSRFYIVMEKIFTTFDILWNWYDYDNRFHDVDGYFNSNLYSKEVFYTGSIGQRKDPLKIVDKFEEVIYLDSSFPTRWLFDDFDTFEQELIDGKEKYLKIKAEACERFKKNRQERKERRFEFCRILKEKLTKEEIDFVITNISDPEKRILKG